MKLQSSAGSDRAWVWTVQADYADEEAKVEQLAIRFKNAESMDDRILSLPPPLSLSFFPSPFLFSTFLLSSLETHT